MVIFNFIALYGYSQKDIGIPPSPTVASLVSVEKDVVSNSGRVAQNLSLWNMKLGEDTFPINLIYSSSGIKIEEIPSYIGVGWNLFAGGVITRSVIDLPDDILSNDHGSGILHTNIMTEIAAFQTNILLNGYNESSSLDFFKDKINESNLQTRNDTQPDLFYFNFFGYSGKFVFNKNKEIVNLSNDNFKFKYTLDSSDNTLKTFTVIDIKGTEYLFSEREYSQTHYNSASQWEFLSSRAKRQRQLDFYSSWHLKSVKNKDNLEILFEYDDEMLTYQIKNAEMGKICVDQQCEDTNINDTSNYDIANSSETESTDFIINSKKIKLITSDSFKLVFNNSSRDDLNGGLKLNELIIKDYNNIEIKKYNFQHSYFISPNIPSSNNYEYKRLKLDKILENDKFLQEFQYYTDFSLPSRVSTEQDFWGYFNDNNSNSLVPKTYVTFNGQSPEYHIFPPINESIVYEYGSIGRNTNPTTVHMGMLKKISYQTGGYKEFFYEPNDFTLDTYTTGNTTINGNGVRVDRIEYFDGQNIEHLDYDYNSPITGISSGKVSYLPMFATHIPWNFVYEIVPSSGIRYANPAYIGPSVSNYGGYAYTDYDYSKSPPEPFTAWNYDCVFYDGNGGYVNYSPTVNPDKYFAMTTRRFSSSQIALASNITEPLVYEYVSIDEGGNGKKQYNFNVLGGLDVPIPNTFNLDKFIQKQSYKTYYWQTSFFSGPSQTTPSCPQSIATIDNLTLQIFNTYYQYANVNGESHPYAPKPNWNRFFGQLNNYTYSNELGFKVYKEEYQYDLVGSIIDTGTDNKITSLKYRLFNRPIIYGINKDYDITVGPTAWLWSFYDIYYNIGLVPTHIIKTNYYNNETSSVSETSTNTYTHGNLLSSTSYEDSNGDVYHTKYKYPIDFQAEWSHLEQDHLGNWVTVITPNIYKIIADKNIHNIPIEIVKTVNNKVVSTQIDEYGVSSYYYVLSKSSQLEKKDLLDNYVYAHAYSDFNGNHFVTDEDMVSKITISRYDNKHNVEQYKKEKDNEVVILWGYKKTVPIARIEGASFYEVNTWFNNEYGQQLSYLSTLSNNDIDDSSEQNLKDWLNNLRQIIHDNNKNITVTTFTYDPLIGVTSITDPRGYTTYYKYDEFNRLEFVKDADNKILSKNKYHYKEQQ
ncbi:MAG: YD repeat protein [Flavobacteriaceae bacterium FS1-H7996/R]|nr:MAG: YD repeat protein [Flavobacteriaceae bacterium FS1-H7996/R]